MASSDRYRITTVWAILPLNYSITWLVRLPITHYYNELTLFAELWNYLLRLAARMGRQLFRLNCTYLLDWRALSFIIKPQYQDVLFTATDLPIILVLNTPYYLVFWSTLCLPIKMTSKYRKNRLYCFSCKRFLQIFEFPWKIDGIICYKKCLYCHLTAIRGWESKALEDKYASILCLCLFYLISLILIFY
jgi:hypothetical protein